jgi:hypothetical protein
MRHAIDWEVAEAQFCVLDRAAAARRRRCAASPGWSPDSGEIEIAGKLVNAPARRC